MSRSTSIAIGAQLAAIALATAGASAQADPAVFQLDSSQTRISIAGEGFGIEATAQEPDSLTTAYSGHLLVDLDELIAPTMIELVDGEATAANNGSWLPNDVLGSGPGENSVDGPGDAAPGNYGVLIDGGFLAKAVGAMREVIVSISGPPQPIIEGQFAASQTFMLTSGRFDYNLQALLVDNEAGSENAAGEGGENEATEPGTYHFADGMATLVIPVAATLALEEIEVRFGGDVVATALLGDVNADGQVNGLDVDPFVTRLLHGPYALLADMNGDGQVNGLDVDPLVATIVSGAAPHSAQVTAVAEPSTALLLAAAGVLGLLVRRR